MMIIKLPLRRKKGKKDATEADEEEEQQQQRQRCKQDCHNNLNQIN